MLISFQHLHCTSNVVIHFSVPFQTWFSCWFRGRWYSRSQSIWWCQGTYDVGEISPRKVLDPTLLWCFLIGWFTEWGVSLPDWLHGNIPVHTHLLSGNWFFGLLFIISMTIFVPFFFCLFVVFVGWQDRVFSVYQIGYMAIFLLILIFYQIIGSLVYSLSWAWQFLCHFSFAFSWSLWVCRIMFSHL